MYLEHPNITVKSIGQALEFLSVAFPSFRCRGEGAMFGDAALGRRLHFGNDETYLALQEVSSGVPLLERHYDEVGFEMSDASSMGQHPRREYAYFYGGCGFEWEFVQHLSEQTSERNDYVT